MLESIIAFISKDGWGMTLAWIALGLMIASMAFIYIIFIADAIYSFILSLVERREKKLNRSY